ncbi:2-oxoglutarate and iron-dependent oxygenase domain-containing protein 1, partial [Operophtera brumata]
MSSPSHENEEASSTSEPVGNGPSGSGGESAASENLRPPAKRPASTAVIEISDTESDDSDICAITSYQASADEVKRIRGDDYSSTSSSSSEYSSDSESQCEDDSVVIDDKKIGTKAIRAQLYPRANRMEDPKLNNKIKSQELIDRLTSHWQDSKDLKCDELTLMAEPFRVCLLHNFLSNSDIINNIVDDMNTLDWSRKKMDLYEFHQTTDLASLTWQRSIRGIYELLKTEVMSWCTTTYWPTGASPSSCTWRPGSPRARALRPQRTALIIISQRSAPTPSIRYVHKEPGDGWSPHMGGELELLAHDEAGPTRVTRRIYPRNNMLALFKVGTDSFHQEPGDGWSPHMGGELELLAHDEAGPTRVTRRIYPRNNMLALFKVGTDSFHQEPGDGWSPHMGGELELLAHDEAGPTRVTRRIYPRNNMLALFKVGTDSFHQEPGDGWSPHMGGELELLAHDEAGPTRVTRRIYPRNNMLALFKVLLSHWVEPAYMAPRNRAGVQAQMERRSEAYVEWIHCGPSNQRHYSAVSAEWAEGQHREHSIRSLLKLFSSGVFCKMLTDCTDLVLAGYEALELQRWRAGDFTLIPPREQYQQPRLEAVLYLGAPDRPLYGGVTTYLAPEDPDGAGPHENAALVYLPPEHNTLNLVYCDAGAASFRKYLSKLAMQHDDCFYVLTCTYRE